MVNIICCIEYKCIPYTQVNELYLYPESLNKVKYSKTFEVSRLF